AFGIAATWNGAAGAVIVCVLATFRYQSHLPAWMSVAWFASPSVIGIGYVGAILECVREQRTGSVELDQRMRLRLVVLLIIGASLLVTGGATLFAGFAYGLGSNDYPWLVGGPMGTSASSGIGIALLVLGAILSSGTRLPRRKPTRR